MIMGVEMLKNQIQQFERKYSVHVHLAVIGVFMLHIFEREEKSICDPVDHVVVSYDWQ